jgi:hypothetical protein
MKNIVHNNDNIGVDAIGFEGVGPAGSDQAKYGVISGNTVYNISSYGNPAYGNQYDFDHMGQQLELCHIYGVPDDDRRGQEFAECESNVHQRHDNSTESGPAVRFTRD